jgi:uncharacterized protein (DUF486 family)
MDSWKTSVKIMPDLTHTRWLPILLLIVSNVFMTFAWYGHLNHKNRPLWVVTLVSWGIAFFEYWLAVPANRWGSNVYSPAQLKIMQEVITLVVFSFFSIFWLHSPIKWNHIAAFGCVLMAVAFIVLPKS